MAHPNALWMLRWLGFAAERMLWPTSTLQEIVQHDLLIAGINPYGPRWARYAD